MSGLEQRLHDLRKMASLGRKRRTLARPSNGWFPFGRQALLKIIAANSGLVNHL